MSSNHLFISFSCALIILYLSTSAKGTPQPVEEWFKGLPNAKETKTIIHFYFQDVIKGNSHENQTVYKVAESEITSTSPKLFGQINMIDDLLTSGPEPHSEVVGRAQGTTGFAGFDEFAIQMSLNIVFTGAKYNGSTISILGRNPGFEKVRELPIVGGTGVFRMARGLAVTSTYSPDMSHGILEYTLYVTHYAT